MLFFHYVTRKLVRRAANNALTVIVIALVLIGCMLGLSFYLGLRHASLDSLPANHILITSQNAIAEQMSGLQSDTVKQLAVTQGIDTVGGEPAISPEVISRVLLPNELSQRASQEPVNVRGVDPVALQIHAIKIISGRAPGKNTPELAIGTQLLQRFPKLQIGTKIDLPGEAWEIVGVFSANGSVYEGELWGDRPRLMTAAKQERISSVLIATAPNVDPQALMTAINGDKRVEVTARLEREFRGSQARLATVAKTVLILVIGLVLIGVFVTSTNLHASLLSRIAELGSLIALGVRRNRVASLVLMESLVLAFVGAAVAFAVTLSLDGRSSEMFNADAVFRLRIDAIPMIAGLVLAVIMGIMGGLVPAMLVRRLDLIRGMR